MTDTITREQLAELHKLDADMRAAWATFDAALTARAAAMHAVGAPQELTVAGVIGTFRFLRSAGDAVSRLRSGESLDVAVGEAMRSRRGAELADARLAAEKAATARRDEDARAALLGRLNERLDAEKAERERALRALDDALDGKVVEVPVTAATLQRGDLKAAGF